MHAGTTAKRCDSFGVEELNNRKTEVARFIRKVARENDWPVCKIACECNIGIGAACHITHGRESRLSFDTLYTIAVNLGAQVKFEIY